MFFRLQHFFIAIEADMNHAQDELAIKSQFVFFLQKIAQNPLFFTVNERFHSEKSAWQVIFMIKRRKNY